MSSSSGQNAKGQYSQMRKRIKEVAEKALRDAASGKFISPNNKPNEKKPKRK
jgi:hypothetical protein